MIKQNQEDYLRAIYDYWEQKDTEIHSVDIAKYLNISKASVSQMLKKLAKQKYIKTRPYSKISFTVSGLKKAKKLTHKHRIIEVFLKKILGINQKDIHQEAHELEHCFSDNAIKKLAAFVNNPKYCPGGKKIPKV